MSSICKVQSMYNIEKNIITEHIQ